jgi:hypothetical protein
MPLEVFLLPENSLWYIQVQNLDERRLVADSLSL